MPLVTSSKYAVHQTLFPVFRGKKSGNETTITQSSINVLQLNCTTTNQHEILLGPTTYRKSLPALILRVLRHTLIQKELEDLGLGESKTWREP